MLYIYITIGALLLTFGLLIWLKKGNKEFSPKLSLKERTELEKMVEKEPGEIEVKPKEKKEDIPIIAEVEFSEPAEPKSKPLFPSKQTQPEVSRFSTHIDLENSKVQHSIRNGVNNFINEDYKVALEEFSLATESNPRDSVGFYLRGLTKLKLKNFESAISDFSEAINLKMKEPNALYYRALSYQNLRDFDNAILNFKGYINHESNSPEAYYDLGVCLKEKDKVEEAIKNFSLAIQKRPAYELAYFERGLLRHKQGDNEGGCGDLKKAFGLGYLQAENFINELCSSNPH